MALIIVVALIIVGGGIWYYKLRQSASGSGGQRTTTSTEATMPPSTPSGLTTISADILTSTTTFDKYIDPGFGFSFWYPGTWSVQDIPVQNPNAYQGGTVIKEIEVQDPAAPNLRFIDFMEYHSASDTITFAGTGGGPTITDSNFSSPIRFYFDPTLHTWMTEYPNGEAYASGNSAPANSPTSANVSKNTMGGLHIITGLTPYDEEGVVPLSAQNFLVVDVAPADDTVSIDALIKTIMATSPAVAVPVSQAEQSTTIEAEINYFNNMSF